MAVESRVIKFGKDKSVNFTTGIPDKLLEMNKKYVELISNMSPDSKTVGASIATEMLNTLKERVETVKSVYSFNNYSNDKKLNKIMQDALGNDSKITLEEGVLSFIMKDEKLPILTAKVELTAKGAVYKVNVNRPKNHDLPEDMPKIPLAKLDSIPANINYFLEEYKGYLAVTIDMHESL